LSVWDIEKNAAILKLYDTAEEAFAHLKHITISTQTAFVFSKSYYTEITKDKAFLLGSVKDEAGSYD